jgi:transposase
MKPWQKKTNVARVHEKVKNQRKDFNHQVTESRHTAFVVEDLNMKGMVKHRRLARTISDVVRDSSFCSYRTNASEPERPYTKLAAMN